MSWVRWFVGLVTVVVATGVARAQSLDDLREVIRGFAVEARYPAFLVVLADLAEESELSGGRLHVDGEPGLSLSLLSLPLRRDFDWIAGVPPLHVEATLGYSSARVDIPDLWGGGLPGGETRVVTRYDAYGGDLGIGPSLSLGEGFIAQPLAHTALSYVTNDADYSGPGATLTRALADGILFNWDGWYWSYGGSLALRQTTWLLGDVEIRPLFRYDVRRTDSLRVDDAAQDAGDITQWLTARVDLDGPTAWSIAGRPVHWQADVGYRRLLGVSGDLVGFDDYYEFGAGVSWRADGELPLLSTVRLSGALLIGDGVIGWTAGASVRF